MRYRLAIFDFDGTLADSFPFFVSVFSQLAHKHDFKTLTEDEANRFRHCSPREMMKHMNLPMWKLPRVAADFTSLMGKNVETISLFAGIPGALQHLTNNGVKLAMVTSNSRDNVERVLGPQLMNLFHPVECGMSIFGKHSKLKKVLRHTGIPANEAIYIGDQIPDLQSAKRAGLAFGAVAWGYGTIESLRAHSPEAEFQTVSDLQHLVT